MAVYQDQVKVSGIPQGVNAQAFGGDASWIDYGIITGHWYDAPGDIGHRWVLAVLRHLGASPAGPPI